MQIKINLSRYTKLKSLTSIIKLLCLSSFDDLDDIVYKITADVNKISVSLSVVIVSKEVFSPTTRFIQRKMDFLFA